jgi:hypothetical protein
MTACRFLCLTSLLLAGCSINDSRIADHARLQLMGMSEVDLQSCLGAPDQRASVGNTDILTYYATSTSSNSFSLPIVGGFGFSFGGYCHATFQLKDSHVTQILYSGEKNATFAPDAYCAPILRTCLDHLDHTPAAPAPPPDAKAMKPTAPDDRDLRPHKG